MAIARQMLLCVAVNVDSNALSKGLIFKILNKNDKENLKWGTCAPNYPADHVETLRKPHKTKVRGSAVQSELRKAPYSPEPRTRASRNMAARNAAVCIQLWEKASSMDPCMRIVQDFGAGFVRALGIKSWNNALLSRPTVQPVKKIVERRRFALKSSRNCGTEHMVQVYFNVL